MSAMVFLIDVDNTLLDNDQVTADLKRYLIGEVGLVREERYWAIFEELRAELGYADYLGALQRFRVENPGSPTSSQSPDSSSTIRSPTGCSPMRSG